MRRISSIFLTFLLFLVGSGSLWGQNLNLVEYFINTDPGVGNAVPFSVTPDTILNDTLSFNTSGLPAGYHHIFFRSRDINGTWSITGDNKFYIFDPTPPPVIPPAPLIVSAEYFIDQDPGPGNGNPLSFTAGNTINETVNISTAGLPPGHHWLFIRSQNATGAWSVTAAHPFFIIDPAPPVLLPEAPSLVAFEYFFDVDPGPGNGNILPYVPSGDTVNWNFYVSIAGLDTGLHFLYIRAKDSSGTWSIAHRDLFTVADSGCVTPQPEFASDTVNFGNSTTFTNLSTNTSGGTSWAWDIGNDGSIDYTTQNVSHPFPTAGYHYVKLTADNGMGCISSIIRQVVVGPVPDASVSLNGPAVFCSGDSVVLTAAPGMTYYWSTGQTTQSIAVKNTGAYVVTVTNGAGFSLSSAPVLITVNQTPSLSFTVNPANTAMNNGSATVIVTGGTGSYSYLWSNGQTNQTAVSLVAAAYSVMVDDGLCPVSGNVSVGSSGPPTDLVLAEYFVDEDPGVGNATPVSLSSGVTVNQTVFADLTGIPPGWHHLFVRVKEDNGAWSISNSQEFFIKDTTSTQPPPPAPQLVAAEYFFDTDPGPGNATPVNVIISPADSVAKLDYFPTAGLSPGTHYVYVRFRNENGSWSLAYRDTFNIFTTACTMPLVDFVADTVLVDSLMTLTNLSTGTGPGTLYEWDIDNDGSVEYTTENATHTFTVSGLHEVKLTVENTDTCTATLIKKVVVGSFPIAMISPAGPIYLCEGQAIVLTSADSFGNLWSTGHTTQSITVDTSGIFTVTVTNQFGLTLTSAPVQVIVNPVPSAFTTSFQANDGNPTGSATVWPSGGTGIYTYSWSDGQTTQTAINLFPGAYTVTVSDGNCDTTVSANVINVVGSPDVITYAEAFIDTDPGAGNAFELDFPFPGDQVNHYDSLSTAGLSTGFHYVYIRVQDTLDRWSISNRFKFYIYDPTTPIPMPPSQTLVASEYFFDTDPGVGNGNALPITAGDTLMESFTIPTTGLDTGYHHLFIRSKDAGGHWGIAKGFKFFIYDTSPDISPDLGQVLNPGLLAAEYFFDTDPGVWNGTMIPGVTAGNTLNYGTYVSIAGLDTGWHYLYIRAIDSAKSWSISGRDTFYVFDPPCTVPIPDFVSDTVNLGNPTTFINLSDSTHAGTQYQWDILNDGSIEYNAFNIVHTFPAAGIFDVALRVDNGSPCTSTVVHQVVVGPIPETKIQVVGATTFCSGGSVTLNAPGGYPSYLWNTGATTQGITLTQSGNYTVTVTNGFGFSAVSDPVSVTVYPTPTLSTSSNPANNGGNNGSATVTASGGSGSYSYLWSNAQTTSTAINLTGGTYGITVDDGFCPVNTNVMVGNVVGPLTDLVAAEYFIDTDPGVGNGNPIAISAGYFVNQTWYVPVSGYAPGYHHIFIRVLEDNGAWSIAKEQLFYIFDDGPPPPIDPSDPLIAAEYFIDTDPGVGNAIPISVTPGAVLNETFNVSTVGMLTGEYFLFIRAMDANFTWSIAKEDTFRIVSSCPQISGTVTDVSCNQGSDGAIDITVMAGAPPYTYAWSTGATTEDVSGLFPGTYSVIVHDIYNCSDTAFFMVDEPAGVIITVSTTDATCMFADGSASASVSGGIPPYSYSWSTGDTTTLISGLPAGNYTLTVTESNGCMKTEPVFVDSTNVPAITVNSTNVSCNGFSDGAIDISVAGGVFPYDYFWSHGPTTQDVTMLAAGNYTLTLLDDVGCQAIANVIITQPPALLTTPLVFGDSVNLIVNGGQPPYTYLWSNGSTLEDQSGLVPGTYYVTVTDSKPCSVMDTVVISGMPPPTCGKDGYEPNNLFSNAANLYGGAITGFGNMKICPQGDVDYFYVTNYVAGLRLRANLKGLPADYNLELYNGAGGLLASSTNGGLQNEQINYSNAAAGTYVVRVYGQSGAWSPTGDYKLEVDFLLPKPSNVVAVKPVITAPIFKGEEPPMGITVFPNPSDGQFTINGYVGDVESVRFKLNNTLGQRIYAGSLSVEGGVLDARMKLRKLSKGIYYLKVEAGMSTFSEKLMIE